MSVPIGVALSREEIKSAIDDFLSVVHVEDLIPDDRLFRLRVSLDRLALIQHFVKCTFDEEDYPEPPSQDYEHLRENITPKFPSLSFYNLPSTLTQNIGEAEIEVADAIDDIADIARELLDVTWYWANTTTDNALWHFREGYWTHWEEHLRSLQLCLHRLDKGFEEE